MNTEELTTQDSDVTFDEFREEWLQEFTTQPLSPLAKGRRFAFKIVTQWLDVNEDDEDLVICDGSGDGGIDIAYLRRSEVDADTGDNGQDGQSVSGDVWYLFQSKYGTAFQGQETIVSEGRKVIATLTGENIQVSDATRQLVAKLKTFGQQASERDRMVLVFATDAAMSESDRQALDDLRILGKDRIGALFDVEDVSLNTIWEIRPTSSQPVITLSINGNFVDPSSGLRVGIVSLTDLYGFLKAYRMKTGNLDQLYEKNVRQFLGGRRKINRGIAQTLQSSPEIFGLYNNGITIVVSDFSTDATGMACLLSDPYVVNGCQTTKTIWEVLNQRLEAGGTGQSSVTNDWRVRAQRGVVVTKIVKGDSASINNITRYTNSQTAVREQDFLALRSDFGEWAREMAARYDVFLEIQRGGWDSQRAYQKSHPNSMQFTESANAFDLIKVYGAGWLREPGHAFGRSAPFLPGGSVFRRITEVEPIDADDLYVAYQLQKLAGQYNFGRGQTVPTSRRQTRYLYYFLAVDLLRDVLIRGNHQNSARSLTEAFHTLLREENRDALQLLLNAAIEIVDEYLSRESEDSAFDERDFEGDLNAWFKSEALGKGTDRTYRLNSLLAAHKIGFSRGFRGEPSPRSLIDQAITNASN